MYIHDVCTMVYTQEHIWLHNILCMTAESKMQVCCYGDKQMCLENLPSNYICVRHIELRTYVHMYREYDTVEVFVYYTTFVLRKV